MPEILYETEAATFAFDSDDVSEMLHRLISHNIIKETIAQLNKLGLYNIMAKKTSMNRLHSLQ